MAIKYYETEPTLDKKDLNTQENFIWNEQDKIYQLGVHSRVVKAAIVTDEHYVQAVNQDYRNIFPEWDDQLHSVILSYRTESMYSFSGEDKRLLIYLCEAAPKNSISLPYGTFIIKKPDHRAPGFYPMQLSSDHHVKYGQFDLIEHFFKFHKKETVSGNRKRQGVLLYGAPGNGKTSAICNIAAFAEKEKFRVIFMPEHVHISELFQFREVLQKETSIIIVEELTERLGHQAESLLSFLDGEMSWNNCYVIATTNHPEELPWNIIDRPGRFSDLIEFGNPTAAERLAYFKAMHVNTEDLNGAVEATEGLCFDYVKNILLSAISDKESIPEGAEKYKKRKKLIAGRFNKTGKLGL